MRKLGVERVNIAHAKVKEKIEERKVVKENEIVSKQNKYKNELKELKEKYESMKEERRINEL